MVPVWEVISPPGHIYTEENRVQLNWTEYKFGFSGWGWDIEILGEVSTKKLSDLQVFKLQVPILNAIFRIPWLMSANTDLHVESNFKLI